MKRLRHTALACVLIAPAVHAGGNDCLDEQGLAAATRCAQEQLLEADETLNRTYVDVMNRLQNTGRLEQKQVLRHAERAWIAFRDGECEFRASGTKGASAYDLVMALCLHEMTLDRTGELRAYLVCAEGDLSCPTW